MHLRKLDSEARAIWELSHKSAFMFLAREVVVRKDYYLGLAPWEQSRVRAIAAGMSVYRAVLVGKAAARVWGMPILRDGPATLCLPGDVPVPPRSQWFAGTRYVNWKLPEHDFVVKDGVRVAIRSRVIFDVSRYGSLADALAIMDHTLRHGHATRDELTTALERFAGLPGMKQVRRALGLADGRSESPLESEARAQLIEASITDFDLQVWLLGRYRVDILIGGFLIVEVDGLEKYTDPADLVKEKKRTDALINAGFQMLRITKAKLRTYLGEETAFIREVRERLALGEPVTRRPPRQR